MGFHASHAPQNDRLARRTTLQSGDRLAVTVEVSLVHSILYYGPCPSMQVEGGS